MFGVDDAIGALAPLFGKVFDRIFPDPAEAAKAKLALLTLQQSGELAQLASETDLDKGQLAVNEVEAGSTSLFVSGWRPLVGWIGAVGFGYQVVLAPTVRLTFWLFGSDFQMPQSDPLLITVLSGMLGLGHLSRTVEKIRGVAAK